MEEAVQEHVTAIIFHHPQNEEFFQFAIHSDTSSFQSLRPIFDYPLASQNTKEELEQIKELFSTKWYSIEKKDQFETLQCNIPEDEFYNTMCSNYRKNMG